MGDPSWSTLNRIRRGVRSTSRATLMASRRDWSRSPRPAAWKVMMKRFIVLAPQPTLLQWCLSNRQESRSASVLRATHSRRGRPQASGWQHRGPLGLFAVLLGLALQLGLADSLRQHAYTLLPAPCKPSGAQRPPSGRPSRRQPVACAGNSGRRRPSAVCAVPASCTPAARPAGGAAAPSGRTPAEAAACGRSAIQACDCGSLAGVVARGAPRRALRGSMP